MSTPEPDEEHEPPRGTITPTGPGPLVVAGVLGLVIGWSVRAVCLSRGYAEPDISLVSVAAIFFVAAVVGSSAYVTRRTVLRNRFALAHHHAVNRLVLGKACALVGALLTGGYLGYAVAQLGVGDPASTARLWRSLLAAFAAALMTAAALLLELACRVPRDPE